MKVLIVYSHPSQESFSYTVLEKLISILERQDHQVTVSDLYEKRFQTDLSAEEYKHETELPLLSKLAPDVIEEQKLLLATDCVIFLYPVWWSDCPAKLKGWFDRVWSNGFAYSKTDNPRRLEKIKTGIVICTAGHSREDLNQTAIAESMKKIMLGDRLGDRFENKHMIILAGTLIEENKPMILNRVQDVIKLITT